MERDTYLQALVRLAETMGEDNGPGRATYLAKLVEFGNALRAEAEVKLETHASISFSAEVSPTPSEHEALSLLRADALQILWRVSGATHHRRMALPAAAEEALEALGTWPDLLAPLASQRHEPSYSQAMAFLACPKRSGRLGRECQRAFLRLLASAPSGEDLGIPADETFKVDPEHSGPWGRVDVALESATAVVWVEAKIDAPEGASQLDRYADGIRRICDLTSRSPLLVFLTEKSDQKPPSAKIPIVHVTFRDLLAAWLPVAARYRDPRGFYLRAFLKSVALHLCGLSGPGAFESWSLAARRRTLSFLEEEIEPS